MTGITLKLNKITYTLVPSYSVENGLDFYDVFCEERLVGEFISDNFYDDVDDIDDSQLRDLFLEFKEDLENGTLVLKLI